MGRDDIQYTGAYLHASCQVPTFQAQALEHTCRPTHNAIPSKDVDINKYSRERKSPRTIYKIYMLLLGFQRDMLRFTKTRGQR